MTWLINSTTFTFRTEITQVSRTKTPAVANMMNPGSNNTLPLEFENFFNVIDGKLVITEKTHHGVNPSTLSSLPEVPLSTKEDVDNAVQCAKLAFKNWSQTPILKRREAVIGFANALSEQKTEFATLLVREQGKPVKPPRQSDSPLI
jgi:hypothetical protein